MKAYICDICNNPCVGNEYVLPIKHKDKEGLSTNQARMHHLCKGCENEIGELVLSMLDGAKQFSSVADRMAEISYRKAEKTHYEEPVVPTEGIVKCPVCNSATVLK